jgi:hypothetical protein
VVLRSGKVKLEVLRSQSVSEVDMNASTIYQTIERDATRTQGAERRVRRIILKIATALSFNADGIFKSKDWPYLWPK